MRKTKWLIKGCQGQDCKCAQGWNGKQKLGEKVTIISSIVPKWKTYNFPSFWSSVLDCAPWSENDMKELREQVKSTGTRLWFEGLDTLLGTARVDWNLAVNKKKQNTLWFVSRLTLSSPVRISKCLWNGGGKLQMKPKLSYLATIPPTRFGRGGHEYDLKRLLSSKSGIEGKTWCFGASE